MVLPRKAISCKMSCRDVSPPSILQGSPVRSGDAENQSPSPSQVPPPTVLNGQTLPRFPCWKTTYDYYKAWRRSFSEYHLLRRPIWATDIRVLKVSRCKSCYANTIDEYANKWTASPDQCKKESSRKKSRGRRGKKRADNSGSSSSSGGSSDSDGE